MIQNPINNLNELNKDGRIIGKANFVFTPEISCSIGSIYGSLFKKSESVVVGRDFHNDSVMLKRACTSGLISTGINVLNLSSCTFPLLQFTIRRFGASGGVYISGGHLYSEDVGIRFLDAGGIELSQSEIQKIIESYNTYPEKVRRVEPNEIGQITPIPQTADVYIKSLQQFVDKKKIKKANLKIVVDCSYGPTGNITPLLINDVGVEAIALNTHYRERHSTPIPSINTIRNTADIVKASNSHLGVCYDVDGSRILVIDENGLEVNYEDLLMLFISFDNRIIRCKGNNIITTPSISAVVKKFIEDAGYPIRQIENYPGEISRHIREERACFAAADTLKFYFPSYAPFSDGNFILLKILEIMTDQNDLLSSLIKGFPKGIKVNKTIPISEKLIANIHNRLRESAEEKGYKYHDIMNELKIIKEDVFAIIKMALHRDALLITAESEKKEQAQDMISEMKNFISQL